METGKKRRERRKKAEKRGGGKIRKKHDLKLPAKNWLTYNLMF